MTILVTGSSGFLGSEIVRYLSNYEIITVGRKSSKIIADLTIHIPNLPAADLIIHAAGKAHLVPKTEAEKQDFFDVNVTGTINLLKCLENSGIPQSFIFISTVAVYGKEQGINVNEDAPLLATDPYGVSKIQAETLIQNWCLQNNVICTILRLPLIAGPNPPGNLGAMINGIKKGYYFNIAAGKAKKSIVLAADVAKIIPVAAKIGGTYNLTDGYHPSFSELSGVIAKQLGKNKPSNIPMWAATIMAKAGDLLGSKSPINSEKLNKITSDLTFNDIKAQKILGWKPTPVLNGFKIK